MSVSYWRLRDRYYRLLGSRCMDCSSEYFPPVHYCRRCGSTKLEDREMPKSGSLLTFTISHDTLKGFEDQAPMLIGIIRLDNGVKVLGQIVDARPEELRIGGRMKAIFRRVRADGQSGQIHYGYKFVPESV